MKGKGLFLAAVSAILGGWPAQAVATEIDTIKVEMGSLSYTVTPDSFKATVTGWAGYDESKDTIRIPAQFELGGKKCEVTGIGNGAFAGKSITYISTEGRLVSVGQDAFRGATIGTFYTADGNGPLAVEAGAFSHLSAKTIILGKGTDRIADSVFAGSTIGTLSLPLSLEHWHVHSMASAQVKELFLNWPNAAAIPQGLIYDYDTVPPPPPPPSLPAFLGSFVGKGSVHIPKMPVSETSYRSLLQKEKADTILFHNTYTVTAESHPKSDKSWVVPYADEDGAVAYGQWLTFTALDRPGYHPVRWTERWASGEKEKTFDAAPTHSLQVTEDVAVAVYFASDTLRQDGVEYVVDLKKGEAYVSQNSSYHEGSVPKIASTVTDLYVNKDYKVKRIGDKAFSGNKNIDSLYVPYGVETIGDYAFSGCENLRVVVFPESLNSIAPTAFEGAFLNPVRDIYVLWDTLTTGKVVGELLEELQSVWLHVPPEYRAHYGIQFRGAYVFTPINVWAAPNNASYGTTEGTGVYSYGDSVHLKAIPAPGYVFSNWATRKGDILSSDQEHTLYSLTSDKDVIAIFTPQTFVVNVSSAGEGGYISSGQGGNYHYGDSLTLEATPDRGNRFGYWLVTSFIIGQDGEIEEKKKEVTDEILKVQVSGNMEIVAVFNLVSNACRLRVSSTFPDKGKLVTTSPQINIFGAVDTFLAYGASVTVEIKDLTTGYNVTWLSSSGAILSTENPYTFKVTTNREVIAQLANQYKVALDIKEGGSVLGLSGNSYPYGTKVTLTAVPDPGYVFRGWTVWTLAEKDTTILSMATSERYELSIQGNINVTAAFAPRKYKVNVLATIGGGEVSGADDWEYEINTVLHLTAVPHSGYRFVGWIGNQSSLVSSLRSYDVIVNGDLDLTAVFTDITDQYVVACNENYGAVSTPNRSSEYGPFTTTASPKAGYRFDGWFDTDGNPVSYSSELTIPGPGSVIYIARFVDTKTFPPLALSPVAASSAQAWYTSGTLYLANLEGAVATVVSVGGKRVAGAFHVGSVSESKYLALPAGVYILQATNGKDTFVTKFVVRRE